MGNFINYLSCFKQKRKSDDIPRVDYTYIKGSKKIKEKFRLLINEIYCPFCDELEIPEILKIHSENCEIELKCGKMNKGEPLSLEEYYNKIENSTINKKKCEDENCEKNIINNEEETKKNLENRNEDSQRNYCCDCRKYLCGEHKLIHAGKNHLIKKRSEISSFCLKHKKETDKYCNTCKEYFCKECFSDGHEKWHDDNSKELIEEFEKAKKSILKKDQKLLKMKQFYEKVKSACKSNNNTLYYQNLLNVIKSIESESETNIEEQFYYELAIYKNPIKLLES